LSLNGCGLPKDWLTELTIENYGRINIVTDQILMSELLKMLLGIGWFHLLAVEIKSTTSFDNFIS